MCQRDPNARWSASAYLQYWCPLHFPSYFPYLYQAFAVLSHPDMATPDLKIRFLVHAFEEIVMQVRCMAGFVCVCVCVFDWHRIHYL
jgi:hypothetical protein